MSPAHPAPITSPSDLADPDQLIERITADAYSDDEQLWAFQQAFQHGVSLPCDAFVIGESVSVVAFDYDGNERRGLTARCRLADGRAYVVAASDVVFPPGTDGTRYVASYRKWMGLTAFEPKTAAPTPGETWRERVFSHLLPDPF